MWQKDCFDLIKSNAPEDKNKGIEILYENNKKKFEGFLFNRSFKKEQIEEILQESFIKIFKSFNTLKDFNTLESWCWRILRNTTNDYLSPIIKGREGIKKLESETEEAALEDNQNDSQSDCVSKGLQEFNLAEPDRGYALQLQLDNYPITEVAIRIGRTPAATKEYLSQIRKKVAPFIEHCLENDE